MSDAQDFLNTIPSLMSARSRLAVFASNTEAGELNTLLNEAYDLIAKFDDEIVVWKEIATDLYEAWLEPTGDEVPMHRALKRYQDAMRDDS